MKLIAGFGAALPLMAIMGAVSFNSTVNLVDASSRVDHTHKVIGGLERVVSRLDEAETGQRGFVITGEDRYLEPFNAGIAEIGLELKNVRELTLDNPLQQRKLEMIEPLIQLRLEKLSDVIILRRDDGFESARREIARSDSGKQVMDQLRAQVRIMQDDERRLLEERAAETASISTMAKITIIAGSIMSIVTMAIIAFFLSRNISIPVAKLGAAAANIGQGDLETRVDVSSGDELGELGLSFNKMAEGLQQATASLEMSNRELMQEVAVRKRAEEELKILAANLEVSNRELQDFASVASHDLQEPLRKILAFGDRLKSKCSDTLSGQGQDYLQRMMDAAQRMRNLIDDLLTLSRVSSQGNPIVPVDLAVIAAQVISDLEVAIEQSEGRIEVGELPTIDADATQMRQLLQNLISNALKFHKPDEPIVVKVNSRVFDDYSMDHARDDAGDNAGGSGGAKMIELTVEDTGIGFDETYSDRIFKVFQRLHGKDQYAGTGLGLAVCRKIAERHNGSITAESKPGQGAKFMVTLPSKNSKGESTEWNNTVSLLQS